MFQRITRQLHYGTIEDGTPMVILDRDEWYLALLKDRNSFYYMISFDGHIRYNGKVPIFSEFYFPNGYDILLAKMFTEKEEKESKSVKRNEILYKIKKFYEHTIKQIKYICKALPLV